MTELKEKLKLNFNKYQLIKEHFWDDYFTKTCLDKEDEDIHKLRVCLNEFNLRKDLDFWIDSLKSNYKDTSKVIWILNKLKQEWKVLDTFSELLYSTYFVNKFGERVKLEYLTHSWKDVDIYLDLRWYDSQEDSELWEYYFEVRTIHNSTSSKHWAEIVKNKTTEKLWNYVKWELKKESQFIKWEKNILLLVNLHSNVSSTNHLEAVHWTSPYVTRNEWYGYIQPTLKTRTFNDKNLYLVENAETTINPVSRWEIKEIFWGLQFAIQTKELQTVKVFDNPWASFEEKLLWNIHKDIEWQIMSQIKEFYSE